MSHTHNSDPVGSPLAGASSARASSPPARTENAFATDIPEPLGQFMRASCGLSLDAFHALPGANLPEPARQLLNHHRDMTSTLAEFHGSAIGVEVLQSLRLDGFYLREVFLRATATNRFVEYGVLAVALAQFTAPARAAIEAGRTPLGTILHQFKIPFVSTPLGFFTAPVASLAATPLAAFASVPCYGRLNCLAQPTGKPLAWILEILPPA